MTADDPIAMKSQLLMSIIEQQMGAGSLDGGHRSIIDRCTGNILRPCLKRGYQGPAPLLTDWRREVMAQTEDRARELALATELIVEGTLNVFAHSHQRGHEQQDRCPGPVRDGGAAPPHRPGGGPGGHPESGHGEPEAGKYTWVFVDEAYLFFKYVFSAQFLYKAWKRFRKYAGIMTAATQNVEECLRSETARLMFANSEFLVLYNQAATDRAELARLLRISDTQMGYITNSAPGTGLIRMGGAIVPFINTIPRDTQLYRLMSTTPGDEAEH